MEDENKSQFFFKNLFPELQKNHEGIGWPQIKPEDVEPTYMKALSNMTYRALCKLPGTQPVLAKYFGQGYLARLLDRNVDNKVSQYLGEAGIGPKVLLFTDLYRFEEFVQSEMFTVEDMNDPITRNYLTYFIQNLHRSVVPEVPQGSLFTRFLNGTFKQFDLFREAVEVKKEIFTEEEKKCVEEIKSLLDESEVEWLRNKLQPFEDDLILSHNDFLNGNILKLPNGELCLIDFEYTTYNFRMFDVANFINESLFDYSVSTYPYFSFSGEKRDNDEKIRDMIKYYLLFSSYQQNIGAKRARELVDSPEQTETELIKAFGSLEKVSQKVDQYLDQLHLGYMVGQYFWCLWGVMMSKNPDVDFGYIEYAYARFLDYRRLKNTYYKDV